MSLETHICRYCKGSLKLGMLNQPKSEQSPGPNWQSRAVADAGFLEEGFYFDIVHEKFRSHTHFRAFLRETTCPTCPTSQLISLWIKISSKACSGEPKNSGFSWLFSQKGWFHLAYHQYCLVPGPVQRGVPLHHVDPPPLGSATAGVAKVWPPSLLANQP